MDFKQLLQRIDSLGGKQQLNEYSKANLKYYFGEDKKNSKPDDDKEVSTRDMAKKTDKNPQYTKNDSHDQDTGKNSDTKVAEKKAKKKASEDISDLLKIFNVIAENKKELDEKQTEEGNEFSGELAKAKAAGKKEFEVDGKKYQVKEDKDKDDDDKDDDDTKLDQDNKSDDDKNNKKDLKESVLDEKAAPGQEDWVKSNKERFIKQYGKQKGLEVLYATSWKRSESAKKNKALAECYDQAMIGGRSEQESGMNINASTDTRTGSKSLTVTAQGDAAEQLAQLLKLSGINHIDDMRHNAEMEEAVYVNTPEPEVQGIEVQMQQGNDLNRPKNSFKHSYRQGDNPMAMREEELRGLERRLNKALAEFKVVGEDSSRNEPLKKAAEAKLKNSKSKDLDESKFGRYSDDDDNFRDNDRNVGVENEKNNYAVYINGKVWKVFADPRKAINIARSLKLKGKDTDVIPTGAPTSESFANKTLPERVTPNADGTIPKKNWIVPGVSNDQSNVSATTAGSTTSQTQGNQNTQLQNLTKFGVKTVKDLGDDFTHIQYDDRDGIFDGQSNQMYFYNSETNGLEKVSITNGRLNTTYTSIKNLGPETKAAFQKAGITIMQGSGIKIDNTSPADDFAARLNFQNKNKMPQSSQQSANDAFWKNKTKMPQSSQQSSQPPQNLTFTPKNAPGGQ